MEQQTALLTGDAGIRDLVDRLVRFDGPPDQFLRELLAAQCRFAEVAAGAVVRTGEGQRLELLATHPAVGPTEGPPYWLALAVDLLRREGVPDESLVRPVTRPDAVYGQGPTQHLILVPLKGESSLTGCEAFVVETGNPSWADRSRQRLEVSLFLLSLYEMRQTLSRRESDLRGLSMATTVLARANEHGKFRPASLAFCNEVASRWKAERVSFGVLAGRYVKLRAMSQTEHIVRKMALVQTIEGAMEECLDQDVEVMHPAPPEVGTVNRAAAELSERAKAGLVLSLPIRRDGEPQAVLTVERRTDEPFTPEQVEFLRLACDLCGPRLLERHETDRWVGARAAASTRRGAAMMLGAQHTWAKLTAVLLLAAILAVTLIQQPFRVTAPFTFEAVTQRTVAAPFNGFLMTVNVEPGDAVNAGDVLATLDTAELRLQLAQAMAEQRTFMKQADIARREHKAVEVQIAEARAAEQQARIDLLTFQINHAELKAPVAGTVVTGDLKQKLGAPVSKGDALFEVAPLAALRAVLRVPDDDIAFVRAGQPGALAAALDPGRAVPFTVEQVNPIAEVIAEQNVFRVKAELADKPAWLRPGIEGIAKIDAGRASIAWVWTREAIAWVRLKLWL